MINLKKYQVNETTANPYLKKFTPVKKSQFSVVF